MYFKARVKHTLVRIIVDNVGVGVHCHGGYLNYHQRASSIQR